MNDSLLLLSNFIKNPKQTGAVATSSKFLTKKIMNNIDFKNSKVIVELGPGLGTMTKVILKKSSHDTRIFCFEVNKKFCDYLNKNIKDKRVIIINDSAEKMDLYFKKLKIKEVDCMISGIPFSFIPESKKIKIIHKFKKYLSKNGKFIFFQYTNGLSKLLKSYFAKVDAKFVPLNIPPSFIYICEK